MSDHTEEDSQSSQVEAAPPIKTSSESARDRQARIRQRVLQNRSERLQNFVSTHASQSTEGHDAPATNIPSSTTTTTTTTIHQPQDESTTTEKATPTQELFSEVRHRRPTSNSTPNPVETSTSTTTNKSNHAPPKKPRQTLSAADITNTGVLALQMIFTLGLGIQLHLTNDAFIRGHAFQSPPETATHSLQSTPLTALLSAALSSTLLLPLLANLLSAPRPSHTEPTNAHPPSSLLTAAASGVSPIVSMASSVVSPSRLSRMHSAVDAFARFFDRLCLSLFVLVVALYVPHLAWDSAASAARPGVH